MTLGDNRETTRHEITKIDIHPDFGLNWVKRFSRFDADLAVLTLNSPVKFGSSIKEVYVPLSDTSVAGESGLAVRHFFDDEPDTQVNTKLINIPTSLPQECIFLDNRYMQDLSRRGFCAGSTGQIPCNRDGGGGFHVCINNEWNIYGIFATALINDKGGCDRSKPAIFTNVSLFANWIKEKVPSIEQEREEEGYPRFITENKGFKLDSIKSSEQYNVSFRYQDDDIISRESAIVIEGDMMGPTLDYRDNLL